MVKKIIYNEELLALIVDSNYDKEGISFFTENDLSQQLAYMKHATGKIIEPHVHNISKREVHYTQEILFIKSGKLRVDFYNDNKEYLESHVLKAGDVILLASGGHGFNVLEDIEMFEVKQGPYIGEGDKTRFVGIQGNESILYK